MPQAPSLASQIPLLADRPTDVRERQSDDETAGGHAFGRLLDRFTRRAAQREGANAAAREADDSDNDPSGRTSDQTVRQSAKSDAAADRTDASKDAGDGTADSSADSIGSSHGATADPSTAPAWVSAHASDPAPMAAAVPALIIAAPVAAQPPAAADADASAAPLAAAAPLEAAAPTLAAAAAATAAATAMAPIAHAVETPLPTEAAATDASAANVAASVLRMDRAAVPAANAKLTSVAAAMAGEEKARPTTTTAGRPGRAAADAPALAPAPRGDVRFSALRAAASNRAAGQEQKIKGAEPTPAAGAETLTAGEPVGATAPSNGPQAATHGTGTLPAAPVAVDSPRNVVAQYHRVEDVAARFNLEGSAPADQLSIRLLRAAADGRRALQVHLHPADLGSVDVKMQWQGDRMTAQFVADRPETLDMLRRDVPALERTLNQAGVNVDAGGLSFSLRQQQGGTGNGQGSPAGSNNAPDGGDGTPGDTPDMPLGQVIRDGILSIRV